MEHTELEMLKNIFDARYRQIDDCERTTDEYKKRLDRLQIEFVKGNTKLNILIAILTAIGGPVIALCVKMLFGGA